MGLGLKTYLHSRFHELTGRIESFGGGYHEWNCRRIRVMLDHYGYAFFGGKSVIELGAGFGELGGFFSLIGSKVTCLEGRKANVAVIRRRQPFVIALQHDLNAPTLPTGADQADFIIHFGVLYHLRDPDAALRQACKACTHMVLETECSDSDDPGYNLRKREHSYKKDQALDGIASSPSPAFVERVQGIGHGFRTGFGPASEFQRSQLRLARQKYRRVAARPAAFLVRQARSSSRPSIARALNFRSYASRPSPRRIRDFMFYPSLRTGQGTEIGIMPFTCDNRNKAGRAATNCAPSSRGMCPLSLRIGIMSYGCLKYTCR
jgi:SAM-dependent methyltransferase